jgi:hypothetical protein
MCQRKELGDRRGFTLGSGVQISIFALSLNSMVGAHVDEN